MQNQNLWNKYVIYKGRPVGLAWTTEEQDEDFKEWRENLKRDLNSSLWPSEETTLNTDEIIKFLKAYVSELKAEILDGTPGAAEVIPLIRDQVSRLIEKLEKSLPQMEPAPQAACGKSSSFPLSN